MVAYFTPCSSADVKGARRESPGAGATVDFDAGPLYNPPMPSRSERITMTLIAVGLGLLLAAGFLPTAGRAFALVTSALGIESVSVLGWGERLAFPLLALFFHVSLRAGEPAARRWSVREAAETLPLPLGIALAYGWFRDGLTARELALTSHGLLELGWYAALVPVGEELLFRGWFYSLFAKRYGSALFSPVVALPVPVVMSSLGFALWHLQNLGRDPVGIVVFQASYTLLTGAWLGYLRWKTGKLGVAIAAHMALNLATLLF